MLNVTIVYGYTRKVLVQSLKKINIESAQQLIEKLIQAKHQAMYKIQIWHKM